MNEAPAPLLAAIASTEQQLLTTLAQQVRRGERNAAALLQAGTPLWQLAQWLPRQHHKREQLDRLRKLLPALLQPQAAAAQIKLLAYVHGLQHEWALTVNLPALRRAGAAALPWVFILLREIQQQQARTADHRLALGRMLAELACITRTGGTLVQLCKALQRLQGFLDFAGTPLQRQLFASAAQVLTVSQVAPQQVEASQVRQAWLQLWCIAQGKTVSCRAEESIDLELLEAVQRDLAAWRWQLQAFLQPLSAEEVACGRVLPYPVLLVYYRLPWVLAAAAEHSAAQLMHVVYHALLAHWQQRLPINAGLHQWLQRAACLLDIGKWTQQQAGELWHWQRHLLQHCSAPSPALVPDVPTMLSRSFQTLSSLEASTLQHEESFLQVQSHVQEELRLLEFGAAAVRMHAVEQFSSAMLALLLQRQQGERWPAALLSAAFSHLLAMLDAAAAWQDPRLDNDLLTQLSAQAQTMPEADDATRRSLRMRLQGFALMLAQALDQPLRLELPAAIPEQQLTGDRCNAVLQMFLRFLLLHTSRQAAARKQARLPRTLVLQLQITVGAAEITVDARECYNQLAVEPAVLQAWQQKLGRLQSALTLRLNPQGREWRLLIAI